MRWKCVLFYYCVCCTGCSEIEVCMVLPWRDNVWIYCLLQSAWPLNNRYEKKPY